MKEKLKRKEPERLDVHLRRALRRAEHIRDYVLQERDRFRHGSVSEAYREEVARKLKGHRKEYAAAASILNEFMRVLEDGDRALERLQKIMKSE